jgi:hypothetical protein
MPEPHGESTDAAASARRRYRIDLVELTGATYRLGVGSRDGALERIAEAFEANPDIVYADLFTPAGDWSDRIARTSPCGHLVAAPATDTIPRRKTP